MISRISTFARAYHTVVRQAGAHLIYQGLALLIPFLLLPVITRLAPPHQYGVYALYLSVVSVLSTILTAGVDQMIASDHFRKSPAEKQELFGTYFLFLAGAFVVLEGALFLGRNAIAARMEISPLSVLTLGVLPLLTAVAAVGQMLTMMDKKLRLQGVFIVTRPVLTYVLGIPLLAMLGGKWSALVAGAMISFVPLVVLTFWYLARNGLLKVVFRQDMLWRIFTLGSAVVVYNVTFGVVGLIERFSIEHFAGAHQVGLYAVISTIMIAVTMGFVAISRVSSPWMIRRIVQDTPEAHRDVVHLLYAYYMGIALVFAGLAVTGGPLISLLIHSSYDEALTVIPYLAISIMFYTLFAFTVGPLIYTHNAVSVAVISLAGMLLSLVGNRELVPLWGFQGAAIAGILAYGTMFAAALACAVWKMPAYPWKTGFWTLLPRCRAFLKI